MPAPTALLISNETSHTDLGPGRVRRRVCGAVASWDFYPIPTLERLDASAPSEQNAARAELWVAATNVYGHRYSPALLK